MQEPGRMEWKQDILASIKVLHAGRDKRDREIRKEILKDWT